MDEAHEPVRSLRQRTEDENLPGADMKLSGPTGWANGVPGGSVVLSSGTNPAPKFATSVKVCTSPPLLISVSVWSPVTTRSWRLNVHAL